MTPRIEPRTNCRFRDCKRPLFSKTFCLIHTVSAREQARKRAGCKPWVPGGKGRPPKAREGANTRYVELGDDRTCRIRSAEVGGVVAVQFDDGTLTVIPRNSLRIVLPADPPTA